MTDDDATTDEAAHDELQIERRQVAKVLSAAAGLGAVGAFSVSAMAGLSESGKIEEPEPLYVKGVKLVNDAGERLTVADALPLNDEIETLTVYPEKEGGGKIDAARAKVLLVRFPQDSYEEPTNLDGLVEGYAGYSMVCTHLECPVSEVVKEKNLLHCPCHGSKFDPLTGASVAQGPASKPLPQLPIGVTDGDEQELLLATGGFDAAVGSGG